MMVLFSYVIEKAMKRIITFISEFRELLVGEKQLKE